MNIRWAVLATALAVLAGFGGVRAYREQVQRRVVAELALAGQTQLTQTTAARLTTSQAAGDSLQEVVAAARRLNGRLRAALAIRVPARETTIVDDTLTTTPSISPDGTTTRRAEFSDSTFAGTISGVVIAPPTGPLVMEFLTVRRPEFRPQIGFVDVGGQMVAVVSWQGEQFNIDAPYMAAPKRTRTVGFVTELFYAPLNNEWIIRSGPSMRGPGGLELQAQLEQRTNHDPGVFLGLRKVW